MGLNVRAWVDREQVVDVAVHGARVWAVVARPDDQGARFRHQLVECTPGAAAEPLTPLEYDCTHPTFLDDGTLVVCSDGGVPGGPRQVSTRTPAGDWHTWTTAPGGVEALAAAGAAVVALERTPQTEAPWCASAVAVSSGPARHWNRWYTEDAWQLVHLDRHTGARRVLAACTDRTLSQCALAISPDGSRVVHTPVQVASDGILQRGLVVHTLRDGAIEHTVWGPSCDDHSAPVFSPDGRWLAFVRQVRAPDAHGRRQLYVLELESGAVHPVAPNFPGWLVPCAWTASAGIVCRCIVDGCEGVYAVHPHEAAPRRLDSGGWSWSSVGAGKQIFGVASRLDHRPRVLPIEAAGPPSVVRPWPVPAPCPLLYWPAEGSEPAPLVLMVHGGPVSAWTDSWHPRQAAAFFHALGCHVLMPNPVGSTGHGDAHVEAIWHDWDACTRQLQVLLTQAEAQPAVSQLVVFGGSFGGWAVNRLATVHDARSLAGIITHAGIFDHAVMVAECDEPAAFVWHLGAGAEALHRSDPARSVARWTTPTLILHGAKDFNVPVAQALALHHALERHHVPHRLVVFPDEGHHVLTPRAIARWWSEIAAFIASVGEPDTDPAD